MSEHMLSSKHPWMQTFAKASAGDNSEIARIEDLTKSMTRKIREAFLAAIERIKSQIDLKQIADLLQAGRVAEAIAVVDAAMVASASVPVAHAITQAVILAGQSAVTAMRQISHLSNMDISFGVTNPQTITNLQQYEFDKVRELTTATRKAVAQAVTQGVTDGRNPLDVARDVRQSIGLTDFQMAAVQKFRRALTNMQGDALDRALRDKRFDATVARSIRDQKPLSTEQVDRMVARYEARYLKYRAETIARTEAIRAVAKGNHLAWQQTVHDGKLTEDQIIRKWLTTGDHKVRHAHQLIPVQNKNGVGLNEPFRSILGPIMFPGDPNALPANSINCRCVALYRFRYSPK